MQDTTSNLIVVGGPGINQITWHYSGLKDASGRRVLPAYFDKDGAGTDFIHVAPSGNSYYVEEFRGSLRADYGMIQCFYDAANGRYVLLVSGLGGPGTWAAAKVLSHYDERMLYGKVVIVGYRDTNSDGYLDNIAVAEVISTQGVGVYWDAQCKNEVSSVDWGMMEPGSSTSVMVYVRNEANTSTVFSLSAENWNPVNASQYISLTWDYAGAVVDVGAVVQVTVSLWVSDTIEGVTDFTFDIVVTRSD
jgi:hypothetical protein